MATTEHGCAERHEVCDGMVAIADELGVLVSVRGRRPSSEGRKKLKA